MKPFGKRLWKWWALIVIVAAGLMVGCKKAPDTRGDSSTAIEPTQRHAITGRIECNGEPMTFGYVVFLGSPKGPQANGPRILTYDWAEISDTGGYSAASVPEGEVSIRVITDPEALSKLINRYVAQNDGVQHFGRPARDPGSVTAGPREKPRGSLPPNALGPSGLPPEENSEAGSDPRNAGDAARGSRGRTRLAGGWNPPPARGRDASLPPNMANGVPPEMARLVRAVGKGKETLDGLPEETKELLAKINAKYGAGNKSELHETVSSGQNTLDIKLKVD